MSLTSAELVAAYHERHKERLKACIGEALAEVMKRQAIDPVRSLAEQLLANGSIGSVAGAERRDEGDAAAERDLELHSQPKEAAREISILRQRVQDLESGFGSRDPELEKFLSACSTETLRNMLIHFSSQSTKARPCLHFVR